MRVRVAAAALVLAGAARAAAPFAAMERATGPLRVRAWTGWTDTLLSAVERDFERAAEASAAAFAASAGAPGVAVSDPAAGGPEFGGDVGYVAAREDGELGVGVRAVAVRPGALASSARGASPGASLDESRRVAPAAYLLLAGVWSEGPSPLGLRMRAACFAGTAYARAAYRHVGGPGAAAARVEGTLTGWAPLAVELTGEASLTVVPPVLGFVEAGVRLAEVPRMTFARGAAGARAGDPLRGLDGAPLAFDFGGLLVRAGVKLAL